MSDQIDPNQVSDDPQGQQQIQDGGNDQGAGNAGQSPTEFIELEGGIKVAKEVFEKHAKETFKDAFEAKDNRDKWQAENTRKAQEIAAVQREAEEYRRLRQDPRFQSQFNQQPANPRDAYVAEKTKMFPDVDPRFFANQFDDLMRFSDMRAREAVSPILEQQSQEWERQFVASHPLIKPQTDEYYKLGRMIEKGYDPEDAYQIVYRQQLMEQEFEGRIKKRDDENKKKLTSAGTVSNRGANKPLSSDEAFERNWAKYGNK